MRRKALSFSIFLAFLFFGLCLQAQNKVLIKSIEYDVPIINKNLCQGSEMAETSWWIYNIETSHRWYFQQAMLYKAMNGQIKVYDEKDNELSIDAVKKLVTFSDTIRMARNKPPYNFFDTVITKLISPSEIHSIRFREKWYYDAATYNITKEISEYSPVIAIEKTIKFLNKNKYVMQDIPLFWIKCNNENDKNNFITLTDYILYNCPVFKNKFSDLPQLGKLLDVSQDTVQRWEYIDSVIKNVRTKKINSYVPSDFNDFFIYNTDKMINLNEDELSKLLSVTDTLHFVKPDNATTPYDTIVHIWTSGEEIAMFRFFEKWLINPKTLKLKKEVIGISPCKVILSTKEDYKGIEPLFLILFEKPVRCFAE